MAMHVCVAYLHYLGIMVLFATLVVEHVLVKPDMTLRHVQHVALTDVVYGITAGVVLLTGLLRFAFFGKGMPFYLGNPLFHIKVGVFVVVALLSIYPTRRFLAWRKAVQQGHTPVLEARSLTCIIRLIRLEIGLLVMLPLLAVLMARGIGYAS